MGKWSYGVIFDAGSSGTRVHVYRWLNPARSRQDAVENPLEPQKLPSLHTKKKWTLKVHPGISTFGETPDKVGEDHLSDLVDHALGVVPDALIPSTPVFLLATAGMRLLPDDQRKAVLASTCSYLQSHTKFSLPDCDLHIQVIPGDAEGLYGWIAANYLLGGFDPASAADNHGHATFGFLEMGGASAQIAFAPNVTESQKHANDLKLLRMRTVGGHALEYKVFVTTWLGYGVHEARRRYIEMLRSKAPTSGAVELSDPCIPAGLQVTLSGTVITPGSDEATGDEARIRGTGDFKECLKRTFPLLDKDAPCEDEPCLLHGIHVPAIDFSVNHFVGVSEFWWTTHGVFEVSQEDKAYDFNTYQQKVNDFCSQDWRTIRKGVERNKWGKKVDETDVVEVCFKASWIINMLHNGIGVPRVGLEPINPPDTSAANDTNTKLTSPFRAIDKIDGVEVSWTLGKMVMYAASEIPATGDEELAVGFGSNAPGKAVPDDFQYAGSTHVKDVVSSGKDWHDKLFASASTRRVPGFVVFLVILALAVYLLCGRDRRQAFNARLKAMLCRDGRGPGHGRSGRKRFLGDTLFGYESVTGPGRDRVDGDELELGALGDSSDSDSDAISVSSPRRKRTGVFSPTSSSYLDVATQALTQAGAGGHGLDRAGLMARTESRDRMATNGNRSRSRNGSPGRRGTPMVQPYKASVD